MMPEWHHSYSSKVMSILQESKEKKLLYIVYVISRSSPNQPLFCWTTVFFYDSGCPACNNPSRRQVAIKPCRTATDYAAEGCPYGAQCFHNNGETEGSCACKLPCKLNHNRSCLLFSSVDMFILFVLLLYVQRQQLWSWRDGQFN